MRNLGNDGMKIILASRSPRRKKALAQMVRKFRSIASVEPKKAVGCTPSSKTAFLAKMKCLNAARHYAQACIIAADTLLVCKRKVMGKAKNRREAKSMLNAISGARVEGITSICVKWPGRPERVWTERGWVRMRKLNDEDIFAYFSSNLWKGKAGAINIEEKPVKNWIRARGGEQGAIVGLPLKRLRSYLKQTGVI